MTETATSAARGLAGHPVARAVLALVGVLVAGVVAAAVLRPPDALPDGGLSAGIDTLDPGESIIATIGDTDADASVTGVRLVDAIGGRADVSIVTCATKTSIGVIRVEADFAQQCPGSRSVVGTTVSAGTPLYLIITSYTDDPFVVDDVAVTHRRNGLHRTELVDVRFWVGADPLED